MARARTKASAMAKRPTQTREERIKQELLAAVVAAVRVEIGRAKRQIVEEVVAALRASATPTSDDALLTTSQAVTYCGFKKRQSFLMHISRGHLKPDVPGKRGQFAEHRFKKSTLDRFMNGKE